MTDIAPRIPESARRPLRYPARMGEQTWILVAILLGVPALVGFWAWWTAKRGPEARQTARRQGSAVLGAGFDEVFHPDAHGARQIWETEVELPAPAHLPGDPGPDIESGQITIMLPEEESERTH